MYGLNVDNDIKPSGEAMCPTQCNYFRNGNSIAMTIFLLQRSL
jgi:hypothetical protein